jgi:hypothetical protein
MSLTVIFYSKYTVIENYGRIYRVIFDNAWIQDGGQIIDFSLNVSRTEQVLGILKRFFTNFENVFKKNKLYPATACDTQKTKWKPG